MSELDSKINTSPSTPEEQVTTINAESISLKLSNLEVTPEETWIRSNTEAILHHKAPEESGTVNKEVEYLLNHLKEQGNVAVLIIGSTIIESYAANLSELREPRKPENHQGAVLLCKTLGEMRSTLAIDELLKIISADSNIPEYHRYVKLAAVIALSNIPNDIITSSLELLLSEKIRLKLEEDVTSAIMKILKERGKFISESPETVLDKSYKMETDKAIEYFYEHLREVKDWPSDKKGSILYYICRPNRGKIRDRECFTILCCFCKSRSRRKQYGLG